MNGALWTSHDAQQATGGTSTGRWSATGISIDTRTLRPGDIFVALTGPNFDGHDFVAAAFAKGAVAALVSREVDNSGPLLLVPDTLQALCDLAKAARAMRTMPKIIALTGSVGKTGTKEALRHLLSLQGITHASAASFNNHWGVPLSLALMPADARYAIFEIGMNHPGEIEPLSKLVQPDVALITNVEAVHLGPMGSLEAIAHAKAEIFAGLAPKGRTIINAETNCADILMQASPVKPYIFAPDFTMADAYIKTADTDDSGSTITASVFDRDYTYRVPNAGMHHAENSLAVLLAVAVIGGDVAQAANDYASLPPVGGRGDRSQIAIRGGSITLIDETHNASPIATSAALKVLGMMQGGRRIAVLGDMLELGPESQRLHAALAPGIIAAGVELAFLSGSDMAHLFAALPGHLRGAHAPDSAALLPLLAAQLRDGDIVLVKGSRGSKMKVITDGLKGAVLTHAL